ncbi:hypothetical protein F2Q69_00040637 [Brassica cretica]|uniref:Uncharacterized protein n=1 Tax=Brassica cretica TaxID=69181 RepID=A0A8S9NG84_BRACR|nr:hypothetical protein F2Q69_00040637 [Brassica cretica]
MGEFSCQEVLISLKVWDLRQMKEALKAFDGLLIIILKPTLPLVQMNKSSSLEHTLRRYSTTGGLLCFYDRSKLEIVQKVGISPTCSVVQCAWHPRYLQHLETKAKGGTHILYDPTQSERGACVCVARAPRKKSVDDYQPEPVIHNPHALPLFRDAPSRKRQREKQLKDPAKAHKPELPMSGPGHGGRVGTTGRSLLTQYLLKVRLFSILFKLFD